MRVNYPNEEVVNDKKSIFLAGPVPREVNVKTWRNEALEILEKLGFDGTVYVPEDGFDYENSYYNKQVWWEREALERADVIVFWVPRDLKKLPGFTTNIEFGYWISKNGNKVLYGRPDNSSENDYLDWLYTLETKREVSNNLSKLLEEAIKMINSK